ncbi:MAG: HisA/HisF-related TIM barrel protein, partial [Heyndrickxia sp.]
STDPVEWAQTLEQKGVGELLVTSMDKEGTWQGYELDIIKKISEAVTVPVIANGGAGTLTHLGEAIHKASASAVAMGSMVVFQKKGMGVLVNFPDKRLLENFL